MWKERKPAPVKPKDLKGMEKARERARKANQAAEVVEARQRGKSPGKLTRKERREGKGLK
jgi:hypothetical protein